VSMIAAFTIVAGSFRRTLERIATPCSVKAYGRNPPRLRPEGITFCDTNASASFFEGWIARSAGKRLLSLFSA